MKQTQTHSFLVSIVLGCTEMSAGYFLLIGLVSATVKWILLLLSLYR